MNLPNFYFADLPPEATLTPAMITAAADTLRRNRARHLLPRSTENIIKILCEVGVEWLQPENQFRKFALERGPEETGFTQPILARGLDNFFSQLTLENFQSLLEQEFGHAERLDAFVAHPVEGKTGRAAMAVAPEFLGHIAAGNIPNPTLMSMVLGLLVRSAQFVKCGSGASFLPRLFAHSIYQADPKLGSCLEIAEWRGGNPELENALFAELDCLTVTGEDETLATIRSRLPAKVRFVGYGQKASFGYVMREALREEEISRVVSAAADDITAWDQNGCLSPHVIYVEERGMVESDKFAEKLVVELIRRETSEPRGKISMEESAAIASRRAIYETLATHRADARIWQSQGSTAWTVVFEHDTRFQFSCLNRFVYIKPVPNLAAVLQGIDAIRGKVSTVGIAASPEKTKELAQQFARWGATRICPLGRMQNPPLTWRHDGRPALGDLIQWTDFES
jgi:hypothetical protein